jgi:signal transduction histidine kinase
VEGYLYIILGGEEYDTVAHMLRGSYMLRLSTGVVLAGLFFALLAGLFLFHLLTRRLHRLSTAMETFKSSDFSKAVPLEGDFRRTKGDEIDRLGMIYTAMSDRMIHQMNKIRHADALRRELVSNVSHDLRTPLASLQGYLETLLMKGESLTAPEQRQYLETALKHSERLGKLVAELFELAKLESRERQLDAEPFHLGELVQDIVQKFQLAAKTKEIRVQTKFSEDLPYVFADIGLIERAIQNLVDNAIRYTKEGGTITLSLIPEESKVTVQVADDGYGISQEDIPYIFDRFYQVREQDQERAEGAGLGLAITRRILELHGSQINVLSELSVGTTFTFQLPVHQIES